MFLIMISLVLGFLIVIFALQNSSIVPISFFGWSAEMPLVVVIFVSVFAGAAVIFCLALVRGMKRRLGNVSSVANQYRDKIETGRKKLSGKLERNRTAFNRVIHRKDKTSAEDISLKENEEKKASDNGAD